MDVVLSILAFLALIVGLVGCVVPVLPGPPIGYAGLLLLHLTSYVQFSTAFLVVWAIVTLVVTLLDYYLPVYMTKRFGGSRAATIGSAVGLVVGFFIFPPLGMIICPVIGAFVGQMMTDHTNNAKAFRVALGSFLSFFFGTGIKLIACGLMIFYAVRAFFV